MAVQNHIPKYFGLRTYLSSYLLYFFLVFPFMIFLGVKNIPQIAENKGFNLDEGREVADSLISMADSLQNVVDTEGVITGEAIDSLVERAVALGQVANPEHTHEEADSLAGEGSDRSMIRITGNEGEEVVAFEDQGPFGSYFMLLFFLTLVSLGAGLIYNLPMKRYFRLLRKKRQIPERLKERCKRWLLSTPVLNALIIIMPNLVVLLYSVVFLIGGEDYRGDIERDLFIHFFYLSVVATLLEFLFAFYWHKHRVHIRYIDHIFSADELKVQVFRRKGGKIRNRFLIASGMTTFLPLMIVSVYLILSITPIRELGLETLSSEQREILVGPWGKLINAEKDTFDPAQYERFFYVNAGDSLLMLVGIGNGILVSLIYLLLFIRWTNQDITRPVKELLVNMRNLRGGQSEQYTVVRTNDEIGELAEGYNEMTGKIHEHVESISRMNRDLEKTVKERTREVVMQKEEIEAQKEEIEAQLDLATQQRDTISRQNEQILDSIRYAERIQSAILPPPVHLTEHLSEHFILFRPRDIVSGDYYWTHFNKGKLMIAVADCTGHGVPGAFLSVLGITSMNEIVNRNGNLSAGEVLEQLRSIVIQSLHQTGSRGEANDGIEIALIVVDLKRLTLDFAGANRPVYLLSGGDGNTQLTHLKGDRMPIGIYGQEATPFTSQGVKLKKGDSLYLFSDGYVDQLGGEKRKTFRSMRFRKLLMEISNKPMVEQHGVLEEKHLEWRGDVEQIDDILVLGMRI